MKHPTAFLPLAGTGLLLLSVSAGAYTPEQLDAGRAAFRGNCAVCHGENGNLLPTAQLVGPAFVERWQGRNTSQLLDQLKATMPPEGPGSLDDETYLEAVVFLMQANGVEPDDQVLTATTAAAVVPAPAGGPGGPARNDDEPVGVTVAGTVENFAPLTDAMLRNPRPGDWPMLRHDYGASSYSPLDEITADNAGQLQLAWIWPMQEGGTNQPSPLAYNGVVYLNNTGGIIQALDGVDGSLIWEHRVGSNVAMRGMALYDDKLYLQSGGRLIALNAATGETEWNVEMPDGSSSSSGPLVADGVVVQGMGGCSRYQEQKCFISGYDADTGEQLWRFNTVAVSADPGDLLTSFGTGGIAFEGAQASEPVMDAILHPELELLVATCHRTDAGDHQVRLIQMHFLHQV